MYVRALASDEGEAGAAESTFMSMEAETEEAEVREDSLSNNLRRAEGVFRALRLGVLCEGVLGITDEEVRELPAETMAEQGTTSI